MQSKAVETQVTFPNRGLLIHLTMYGLNVWRNTSRQRPSGLDTVPAIVNAMVVEANLDILVCFILAPELVGEPRIQFGLVRSGNRYARCTER